MAAPAFICAAVTWLFAAAPTCPAQPVAISSWACAAEDLGPELLADTRLSGVQGGMGASWATYVHEQGNSVAFNAPGALMNVAEDGDSTSWHVQLLQSVSLEAPQSGAWYELCVQAASAKPSSILQFAVDTGPPNFTVAVGGGRSRVGLFPAGEMKENCFRFTVDASQGSAVYVGRVVLEFGEIAGEAVACQASLRRCFASSAGADPLAPIRRCYLNPLQEGAGCSKLAVLAGPAHPELALNEFGQDTSGRLACLEHLRAGKAGNSFVFVVNHCELWLCFSRFALLSSAVGEAGTGTVYSQLCEYQEPVGGHHGLEPRSPVFVKLWEWNYVDVARECQEYLGPNGFDAVQVSPVVEHILGTAWWTRYQPVSFKLSSRSGSTADFASMVAACRAVGVEVIVDVLLNHMAEPCQEASGAGATSMPCRGWAGSIFGERRMAEGPAVPQGAAAIPSPKHFHHLPGQMLVNCAVNETTWLCPTSVPPNDCTLCDLHRLPDWDTGLPAVRDLLAQHLAELYRIGVTMIRLDAASYLHHSELADIVNRAPWDYIFQEWWSGVPQTERTKSVGHYRDVQYGWKICKTLAVDHINDLPKLLELAGGVEGIPPENALYPLIFHDRRSYAANREVPTYKNGLEFHQQQKFLLAWPAGVVVRLWGGFGYRELDDGPPGCEPGPELCSPTRVYSKEGTAPRCLATPRFSPMPTEDARRREWVCEHRWDGVAGLVRFRKACRGKPITMNWVAGTPARVRPGSLAFRAGQECFVALQRGHNTQGKPTWSRAGDWYLRGLAIGLPPGRYCDLASVATFVGWNNQSCPREVRVGPDGLVQSGLVREGDLVALYTGARLPSSTNDDTQLSLAMRVAPISVSDGLLRWVGLLFPILSLLL